MVFSTYQSSPLVAEAQADSSTPAFDLAVADEAHRCAGMVGGDFTTILNSDRIRAKKRLFTTATPRTYSANVKTAAEDRGVEVVGMDDEAVFGKVLYSMPFGEAIKRELLTDYRVVIIGVDNPTIAAWIQNRELLKTDSGIENDAESLAAQIGTRKDTMSPERKARLEALPGWSWDLLADQWEEGFVRLKEFAQVAGHAKVPRDHKMPDGYKLGQWVTEQRTRKDSMAPERKVRLEALSGWSWDTRAGRWEEGVSRLKEFIECEGHAKVPRNHKTSDGYQLGQWLTNQRARQGRLAPERKARLEALPGWGWDPLTEQWEEGFVRLKEFMKHVGYTSVARIPKVFNGFPLSTWVARQRKIRNDLLPERRMRLEALSGWSWDPHLDRWEEGFGYLKEFVRREGHAKVPKDHATSDGYRLGSWVGRQRTRKDSVAPEQKARLEAFPGWSWDPLAEQWEEGFNHLKEFVEHEGHARVPNNHTTSNGYRLGSWVITQRTRTNSMSFEQKAKLEALRGWSWNTLIDQWEEGFGYLIEFIEREGHARVPQQFKTPDGHRLGFWVGNNRARKTSLSPERKMRLEALPEWSWDPHLDRWEEGLGYLKEFVKREGHARVPSTYKTSDGYPLGTWVSHWRREKVRLALERKARLEALPGWVWSMK